MEKTLIVVTGPTAVGKTRYAIELAQQYASDYAECQLIDGICRPRILAFACNSDECNPANNSQRSGYNRCNAYPHVAGKYIVKIALKKKVKPYYSIGFVYKFLSVLIKILPSAIKSWLIGKLYG